MNSGFDVVVEGEVLPVGDEPTRQRLADLWVSTYNREYAVRDGALYGEGGRALVYTVAPRTVIGFSKGDPFSQTWRRISPTQDAA